MPETPLIKQVDTSQEDRGLREIEYTIPTIRDVVSAEIEVGRSGTYLQHGYLSLTDYNVELTGHSGIAIYDKMRKNDATVRISLRAIVLPIMAAHWSIEEGGETQKDQDIRDFITAQLLSGDYGVDWLAFTEEALNLQLAYGRMLFEKVFTSVDWNGSTYIGWKKFAPRHPRSVMRWSIGEGETEQFGITQALPTGGTVSIPGDKLIVLVHEKEGDNYEGTSILRSSHKNWYLKDQLYRIDAISHERQGMGIPYAKATGDITPNDAERSLMRSALSNLRVNERSFIEVPIGYEVGFMDMKASTTRMPKDSIEHHDRQIVKNVMAQFIEIGGTGGGGKGSLAASSNQMDLFVLSLEAIAHFYQKAIQQQCIKQLVDLNWPGYNVYPKLKVDKIGPDNATALAETLLKLVQAHLVTPTDDDEQFLREVTDMPDLPEDLLGTIDRSMQPVAPPPLPLVDDGTGDVTPEEKQKNESQNPTDKQASDAIAQLRCEVHAVLYG